LPNRKILPHWKVGGQKEGKREILFGIVFNHAGYRFFDNTEYHCRCGKRRVCDRNRVGAYEHRSCSPCQSSSENVESMDITSTVVAQTPDSDVATSDSGASEVNGPVNVVLVVVDTERADVTSPYNPRFLTTPFLSELARDGVLFRNVYSTAPWPSRRYSL
jgi:hypothetical protein